ncbi:MAG: response regulator [Ignavibacteriaceae bacterium]|jgi:DNA-binding response OmpR family regulator
MNRKTILVIDDDRGSLELIALALEDSGYNIVKALKPADGLKMASELLPGLIILDWYMPKMDGMMVLRKLKEQKATKEIPVIMATGIKTESEDLKLALAAGAVDFVRKPIDEVELNARVKSALSLTQYYNESMDNLKTIHRQEKEMIRQKAEEYKKELEHKKHELISNALRLLQNMESTAAMMDELKKLDKELNENNSEKLHAAMAKYQTKSFQTQWNEFERQFEEVHSGFYQSLLHDFPSLTSGERKLCVYFKMDMTNKDIAALTFAGYDAVRKARIRLKSKLDLSANEDLSEFLNRY